MPDASRTRPIPSRIASALAAAIALASSLTANACDPAAFDFDQYLADHDRDRDGLLQRAELLAGASGVDGGYGGNLDMPVNTAEAFTALDSDRNGALTRDELWQWGEHTHNACADWPQHPLDQRAKSWLESWMEWLQGLF